MNATEVIEAAAPGEENRFTWRGVTFEYQNGTWSGFTSREVPGDAWSATVYVNGWRWTARLTVNGGMCTADAPTPWQALDAAVLVWEGTVKRLASTFAGSP